MPSIVTVTLVQWVVGGLLFVALLNGQRDLAVLSVLVLSVVTGTRLWSKSSLSNLRCELALDRRRVFAGENIVLQVNVEMKSCYPSG